MPPYLLAFHDSATRVYSTLRRIYAHFICQPSEIELNQLQCLQYRNKVTMFASSARVECFLQRPPTKAAPAREPGL